jgi:hypothetical protein
MRILRLQLLLGGSIETLFLMIFGMLCLHHVTPAAQEFGHATGCIVKPLSRWCISERPQQLSGGAVAFRKDPGLERGLPPVDLEPQMKHMPVKDQDKLRLCALFAGIACAEFVTNMQFSESELAVRVADKRTKINKGYPSSEVLPYIVSGLIPHGQGIPYEKFQVWALTGVVKDEYHTTIEEAKRTCCPETPSDRILPAWDMEDDYVFGDEVTLVKIPRPIGFWRDVRLNLFELTPHNIKRLKEILRYATIYVAMQTLQEFDLASKKVKGVNWWENIEHKREGAAKIGLYPDHARKMESGELVITGGHAVCLCGYDDSERAFKFRNSWGTTYGNNGYGYISYDLFNERHNSQYYWTFYDKDLPPKKHSTQLGNTHVYEAFVIVSHPTEQYSPDKITREVKGDEGRHKTKLDEMLQTFSARRAS